MHDKISKFFLYEINDNDTININIKKNSDLIVSLHSNATIFAEWSLKNKNFNKKNIEFEDTYFFTPLNKERTGEEPLCGYSERRQNFHFKTLENGKNEIVLQYINLETDEKYNSLRLCLNIK